MGSRSFNGTSDFARLASAVVTAYPFSMSVWALPTSDPGVAMTAFGLFASASIVNSSLLLVTGSLILNAACNDGATNSPAASSNAATIGAWNHLGGAWASATSRSAILNGNLAGKGTATLSRAMSGLARTSMGARDTSAQALWFLGRIACPAIWNVILTDDEFVALAAGISPQRIRPQNLVWFAPYVEVGSAVQDWVNHNDMAITGATANADTPRLRHAA